MTQQTTLAIIGGTGVSGIAGFRESACHLPETPFGSPSAPLHRGSMGNLTAFYLARHGEQHTHAPHRINYRANLWALREQGVTHIVSVNAVGGIAPSAAPGQLFLPHQIIDYTWGRDSSFHDGVWLPLQHQEFANPYDASLRELICAAALRADLVLHSAAVYGCTQGPRLETTAEIARLERDGCDLVGMTGMPEAALAAELGLAYVCVAMVVNWAAGKSAQPITLEQIGRVARSCSTRVDALLGACATLLAAEAGAFSAAPDSGADR